MIQERERFVEDGIYYIDRQVDFGTDELIIEVTAYEFKDNELVKVIENINTYPVEDKDVGDYDSEEVRRLILDCGITYKNRYSIADGIYYEDYEIDVGNDELEIEVTAYEFKDNELVKVVECVNTDPIERKNLKDYDSEDIRRVIVDYDIIYKDRYSIADGVYYTYDEVDFDDDKPKMEVIAYEFKDDKLVKVYKYVNIMQIEYQNLRNYKCKDIRRAIVDYGSAYRDKTEPIKMSLLRKNILLANSFSKYIL